MCENLLPVLSAPRLPPLGYHTVRILLESLVLKCCSILITLPALAVSCPSEIVLIEVPRILVSSDGVHL